jgi:hypothetical protein
MHVVYLVRPGNDNEALRMSLRSLRFMVEPIDSLTISGYTPCWLNKSKIHIINGNKYEDKWYNVFDNAKLVAEDDDLPDDIVVMNDDFFILKPGFAPTMQGRCDFRNHLMKLRPQARKQAWGRSLRGTQVFLKEIGIDNPISFELHTPFPVDKGKMLDVMDICSGWQGELPPQWRSVYGNTYHHDAPLHGDNKIYRYTQRSVDQVWKHWDMVSTNGDQITRKILHILRQIHPEPSVWELE